MKMVKRFGWVIPAVALAVGAAALVPGALASSNEANLPMPAEVAGVSQATSGEGSETINGQDWNVMRIGGSKYCPSR